MGDISQPAEHLLQRLDVLRFAWLCQDPLLDRQRAMMMFMCHPGAHKMDQSAACFNDYSSIPHEFQRKISIWLVINRPEFSSIFPDMAALSLPLVAGGGDLAAPHIYKTPHGVALCRKRECSDTTGELYNNSRHHSSLPSSP